MHEPTIGPSLLLVFVREVTQVFSWGLLKALVLVILISLTEGVSLVLLIPLLQLTGLELGLSSVDHIGRTAAQIITFFAIKPTLMVVLGIFVFTISARAVLGRAVTLYTFSLEQRLVAHLRERLFKTISRTDWLLFVQHKSSDFMQVLTRELEVAGEAVGILIAWFATSIITLVYIAFALALYPLPTTIVLVIGGTLLLLLKRRVSLSQKRGTEVSDAFEDLYAAMNEHLAGMKVARSHGIGATYAEQFGHVALRVESSYIRLLANSATVTCWLQIGSAFILASVVILALKVLQLTPADLLILLFVFYRLMPMLTNLQEGYSRFIGSLPAFARFKVLERECQQVSEPLVCGVSPTLMDCLTFDHVSVRHADGRFVLDQVTLRVEAGKTTALVGVSGAGKSTLADLAVGLFEPHSGRILLDGTALTSENRTAWAQHIGYITQEAFIYHDTIATNLRILKPDASDAALWQALDAAAASDFVRRLPAGLETVLGDRGVKLSGGERQRLVLARALVRKPRLLVLDEATSSLDPENEACIQQSLALLDRQTMLVIAHRLSTICRAHHIYVLENGHVLESGDWSTLMQRPGGRLVQLYEAQSFLS